MTPEQKAALEAPLPKSAVKDRQQGGSRVEYVDGHHVISEANRIFGHDGWSYSSEIVLIGEDKREGKPGVVAAYSAKVRLTALGVSRDGQGFGSGEMSKRLDAHEKAMKEAETDALKRALRTFGNAFGLALYDKTRADVIDDSPQAVAERERQEKAAEERAAKLGDALQSLLGAVNDADSLEALAGVWKSFAPQLKAFRAEVPALFTRAEEAKEARKAELSTAPRPAPMEPIPADVPF